MFFELLVLGIFIATVVFNVAPDENGKSAPSRVAPVKIVVPENRSSEADWAEVLKTNRMTLYADPGVLFKEGHKVKMWRMADYKVPEINGDFIYSSLKSYDEYDCKEEQTRQLYVSLYHEKMGMGKIMYVNSEVYSWQPILRGTDAESMWEIACGER